ncbi:MIZ zinc finger family protein [Trichomonas vaginalis G3]|uniref:MIZ zinc finger family protein n=1 Tax=Trichomonas vaginalis (strain ATCC PRA-98 / G3) TaxID=412133 RepID=A2E0J3_TRIV3|nr:SUMO transferase protein [Trichomonas vaginalis G3]EAY13873.1 MIZ zinc finger family protein [Trichomonas vaginalis G3]KAI5520425.1 SUMO transferase protein [Trichomonas vaginalis G3]|eukprot:XP_001326096.1 MIZ zinc finger family protein [Trichomonas vaginalis G3]
MKPQYPTEELQRAMSAASPLYMPNGFAGGSFESMPRPTYNMGFKGKGSVSAKFGTPTILSPSIFYSFMDNTIPTFIADILTTENALSFVATPPQNLLNPRFLIYAISSASISTSPIKIVLNGSTFHRRLNDVTAVDVTNLLVPFGQQNWLVVETGGIIVPFALLGVWSSFSSMENIIQMISSKPGFYFSEVSAICPITGQQIEIPAKGVDCHHDNCFDLIPYLTTRQALGVWTCPICGCSLPLQDLRVGTIQQTQDASFENVWGITDQTLGFEDGNSFNW